MTRKDRFYQVMKEKGYDSVVQLMAEGLNRAKNNKNYSKGSFFVQLYLYR